jgi:hypothetical protein
VRAISLWQPWASLVAVGAKRVETRHWPAPTTIVGQRIAIHATKTRDWLHLCSVEPFASYVADREALPLGAIVATVVVDRSRRITPEAAAQLELEAPHEFAFGNYAGGYAWVLRDVKKLDEPIPFRGSQGIFEVPDELVERGSVRLADEAVGRLALVSSWRRLVARQLSRMLRARSDWIWEPRPFASSARSPTAPIR